MIRAVIFDLGGVVLGSPLHVIADYEREQGLETGVINRVVAGTGLAGAWSRHERGELDFDGFCGQFQKECRAAGALIDVRDLMHRIDRVTVPRPEMLHAVDVIRASGRKAAALTNNWAPIDDADLKARFDAVVESSVVGYRKPQPQIYEIMLAELGVDAEQAVFLDDIGANLKPARAMGMTTIKVDDPAQALEELWRVLEAAG